MSITDVFYQASDKLFDDIHWLIVHSLKAVQVNSMYRIEYHMVGNFVWSNFLWFGEFRQFCGFIFLWCTYSNHLVIIFPILYNFATSQADFAQL